LASIKRIRLALTGEKVIAIATTQVVPANPTIKGIIAILAIKGVVSNITI
jgi:hypothetical protein